MDQASALSKLRYAIGDPPTQGKGMVTDWSLGMELDDALERLFKELECRLTSQPTMFQLVAGECRYPMPPDMARPVTVRLGVTDPDAAQNFLIPDSIWRWARDSISWETAQPSTPGRFAVQSRNLILYPPPSEDAVDDYEFAAVFYIANSPGIQAQGVVGTSDNDMLAAIFDAAVNIDGKRTAENDVEAKAMQKRMTINQALHGRHLHWSKRDWQLPVKMKQPVMSIGGRWANVSR